MPRVRAKGRVITRNEVAYCAIDDRSAGRKVIELDLMTEDQHSALPEDEEVTAADRLIIDSPTTTGLIGSVRRDLSAGTQVSGILDRPLEPVIGRAFARPVGGD